MPVDDPSDLNGENSRLKKRVERLEVAAGSAGDTSHAGSGVDSVQVGPFANASGQQSSAYGAGAYATEFRATAIGDNSSAGYDNSTALGYNAATTTNNQLMIGTGSDAVEIPGDLTVTGTFSNPSARRLKRDIIPAPDAPGIFPELVEYEYIEGDGRRRLGYIADDLIGTDAERFVSLDGEGRPAAIDYLGLLVAQVAALSARITELERG